MGYTFYILKSIKSGKYYTGSTENVIKRLAKHNRGEVKSTKAYRPWNLIYKESFLSKQEARKRELQIKSWKSRRAIEKLMASSSNGQDASLSRMKSGFDSR